MGVDSGAYIEILREVIRIIKENRTYDQVFGDIPEGNGAAPLAIFGREVTVILTNVRAGT